MLACNHLPFINYVDVLVVDLLSMAIFLTRYEKLSLCWVKFTHNWVTLLNEPTFKTQLSFPLLLRS